MEARADKLPLDRACHALGSRCQGLLSGSARATGTIGDPVVDLAAETSEELDDPQHFLHLSRKQLLDGELHEEVTLENFLRRAVTVGLSFTYAADFADIFEVRGVRRARRGTLKEARAEGSAVRFGYEGLDAREYHTEIAFGAPPTFLTPSCAVYRLELEPNARVTIPLSVIPRRRGRPLRAFSEHQREAEQRIERFVEESTRFDCDDDALRAALERSTLDLAALRLDVGDVPVIAAGIPWFNAPFGRDTLLASYEALALTPALAESSLRALANFQGTRHDEDTEEEPGKILHELRFGEMVRTRELPHRPYYGSIDATPLFVIVADALYQMTGDAELVRSLYAPIVAALGWIDARSERGTRLVTYAKRSARGLDNQAWKDSRAGVSFPSGERAPPPIAVVEVQGYCADAYRRGAELARVCGDRELAQDLTARAASMRDVIERELWLPELGRYAFAVDGRGRKLPTVVSNAGHLLWSRVPSRARAAATAKLLLSPPSLSTFGVRTLARGQPVYNPLSYHNGTVWPHDNAIIAKGLTHYGLGHHVEQIFSAMMRAMSHFHDRRLPELFCGVDERIVRYPVACSPQAWASAGPFLLLSALLGMEAEAPRQRLLISNPRLPASVHRLELHNLRIGRSRLSIRFRRVGKRCHVEQLDVSGAPLRTQIQID